MKTTVELVRSADDSGVDMIELGMPFSDPLADGPEIQLSSQAALNNGVTLKAILETVRQVRSITDTPLILMGYYNPLLAYGVEKFVRNASKSGADGFIIPDLPVEEGREFKELVESDGMSVLFLVAPTSSTDRIRLIDKNSTDLVYAVTVTGVTGAGRHFDAETDRYLQSLRHQLTKPFVAGFGVSSPDSARRLAQYSDGVVIGSELVRIIKSAASRREAVAGVAGFLSQVRRALS